MKRDMQSCYGYGNAKIWFLFQFQASCSSLPESSDEEFEPGMTSISSKNRMKLAKEQRVSSICLNKKGCNLELNVCLSFISEYIILITFRIIYHRS